MVPTNNGVMSAQAVMDHLTYACYRYNRSVCGMGAQALARLFPQTGAAMEAKYQAEHAQGDAIAMEAA